MDKHETVYYLAQIYRANPTKAIRFAHDNATELRKKGILVFSPIEYSHYSHIWLSIMRKEAKGDFLKEIRKTRYMIAYEEDALAEKFINESYPLPDYVAWDLRMMKTWLNEDSYNSKEYVKRFGKSCLACNKRKSLYVMNPSWDCHECVDHDKFEPLPDKYDTGLVIIMDNNAYEDQFLCLHCNKPLDTGKPNTMYTRYGDYYCPRCKSFETDELPYRKWYSEGCEQEYNWGKANKVRIICLQEYLKGNEVEI